MDKIKQILNNKFYIETFVATILFITAIATNSMLVIIINLLYFIIMLEIVRAVIGFMREQRIKIYILIDAFIILTLREFIVNVVKINKEQLTNIEDLINNSTNFHIMVFAGVLVFLFILRWASIYTSPNKNSIDLN